MFDLRKATQNDVPAILALYSSAVGRPGCTWNENYPTDEELSLDLAHGCAYVYTLDSSVIGAVSVVPENELGEYDFWEVNNDNCREIARVVISMQQTGHGYAGDMVGALLRILKDNGCEAVHLLVAQCNPAAKETYRKLGFTVKAETSMYGNDYFAEELIF